MHCQEVKSVSKNRQGATDPPSTAMHRPEEIPTTPGRAEALRLIDKHLTNKSEAIPMGLADKLKKARERAQNVDKTPAQQIIPETTKQSADEAIIAEIRENIQAQISALRQLDTIITKYVETRD